MRSASLDRALWAYVDGGDRSRLSGSRDEQASCQRCAGGDDDDA